MSKNWQGLLALLLVLVFLAGLGFAAPLDLLFTLASGWASYLVRVVPQVSVDWTGLATSVLCLGGLIYGLHGFAKWFWRERQIACFGELAGPPWQLRWTLSLVGVVVLMFVAGIAGVGLAHQTVWLATSPEPLLDKGMRAHTTFSTVGSSIEQENP